MKQISLSLVIALVSITCICGMCSKEDEADAPAVPITSNRTSGLLISKGRTRNGISDSLIIYHGFSWVGDWQEAYARPYVNPDEMYWHLVHTGANRWRIELNKVVYTGAPNKAYMKYFPNAPQQQRSNFTVVPRTSDSTLFLLNWTGSHFTVRPVLNPSLFLNTASWDGNPPEHTVLRFTTTPQDFFLIP